MKKRISVWLKRTYNSNLDLVPLHKDLVDLAEEIKTTRENSHGRDDTNNHVITVIQSIRITAKTLSDNGIDINSLPRSGKGTISINGKNYLVVFSGFVELEFGFVDDGKGSLDWSPTTKRLRWFLGRASLAAVGMSFGCFGNRFYWSNVFNYLLLLCYCSFFFRILSLKRLLMLF